MPRSTVRDATSMVSFVIAVSLGLLAQAAELERVTGLPLEEARICVTGYDHNRPDPSLRDRIRPDHHRHREDHHDFA